MGIIKKIIKAGKKFFKSDAMELNIRETIEEVGEQTGNILSKTSYKEQATRRQKIDMLSDSWLSKNVRPIGLMWLLALVTFLVIAACFGLEIPPETAKQIGIMVFIALGFYYPGRSVEKYIKKRAKR